MTPTIDLLITGARVVDPASGTEAISDVAIVGSEIAQVAPTIEAGRATRTVDGRDRVLLPGLVDSHVHIEDLTATGRASVAHKELAKAGVTTAVDFANFRSVIDHWHESAAGLTVLGLQGLPPYAGRISRSQATRAIDDALALGAIGVKLLGGHYPSSPSAAATIIEQSEQRGCYVASHAGSTERGSDLSGMEEAIDVAEGRHLHVAHTNAYLRGTTADARDENATALALLRANPNIVSESHLAPLNACFGTLADNEFEDQVTINCLQLRGYPPTDQGLRDAFLSGYAQIHIDQLGATVSGEEGYGRWRENHASLLSFPVNLRHTAFEQACARVDAFGKTTFQGPGEFVVDAIASDGGTWRNVILQQGLPLVEFGALTWTQLALKTSLAPAMLFGLTGKGQIREGADADLVLIDPALRAPVLTIAMGDVIAEGGQAVGHGGRVLTTERGTTSLTERKIPHEVVDLDASTFRQGRAAAPPTSRNAGP